MRDSTRPRQSEGTKAGTVKAVPDEPSRQIGRFRLEEEIGSGAMGVVYRAHDLDLGRTVAIKTIRADLLSQEHLYQTYRSRFYNEASIFGSLSHPNIVTLYDVGEGDQGIPFLAMEYVSGASLADHAESDRQFSFDEIMWLFAQLASGIDYAHEREVIHRDIKPSNVLVADDSEVKIADFGVAKLLGTEFTRSQTQFGTPGYMSPEQVVGKALTNRADIFSLGVVAFELLSGEMPFPGKHVHTVLHKLVHVDPVLPETLAERGLDRGRWESLFGRALAKDPDARHTSASELVAELVDLLPGSWLGHLSAAGSEPKLDFGPSPSEGDAPRETLTLWGSRDDSEVSEVELELIVDEDDLPADRTGT